jgi:hypothetical protein
MLAGRPGADADTIVKTMRLNGSEPRVQRAVAAALAKPLAPGSMEALVAHGWFDSEYGSGAARREQILNGLHGPHGDAFQAAYEQLPEEFDAFYVAGELGERFDGRPRGL